MWAVYLCIKTEEREMPTEDKHFVDEQRLQFEGFSIYLKFTLNFSHPRFNRLPATVTFIVLSNCLSLNHKLRPPSKSVDPPLIRL